MSIQTSLVEPLPCGEGSRGNADERMLSNLDTSVPLLEEFPRQCIILKTQARMTPLPLMSVPAPRSSVVKIDL